jgi:hypothetical protein
MRTITTHWPPINAGPGRSLSAAHQWQLEREHGGRQVSRSPQDPRGTLVPLGLRARAPLRGHRLRRRQLARRLLLRPYLHLLNLCLASNETKITDRYPFDQSSFCRMIAPLTAVIVPQSFSSAARPFAAPGFPSPVSSSPPAGTCEKWTTRPFFVSAHS